MSDLVESMKSAALAAVEASKPCAVVFGVVTSIFPLSVRIDAKLMLTTDHLINSSNWIFDIGDKLILLRMQGGQKFIVVGKLAGNSNIHSTEKYSEKMLKTDLDKQVKQQMAFLNEAATAFNNSTEEAIDIILQYDKIIKDAARIYNVDCASIQSVLFREIRWYNPLDTLADSLVIDTFRYYTSLEEYMRNPLHIQIVTGPPQAPLKFSDDSSTGLGQIFAKTAIDAYNWFNTKMKHNFILDYEDKKQRFDLWEKLRTDNEYNIFTVGAVLQYKAEGLLEQNSKTTIANEIKRMFSRYNGTGDAAVQYGKETYEYFLCFARYNSM